MKVREVAGRTQWLDLAGGWRGAKQREASSELRARRPALFMYLAWPSPRPAPPRDATPASPRPPPKTTMAAVCTTGGRFGGISGKLRRGRDSINVRNPAGAWPGPGPVPGKEPLYHVQPRSVHVPRLLPKAAGHGRPRSHTREWELAFHLLPRQLFDDDSSGITRCQWAPVGASLHPLHCVGVLLRLPRPERL